MSTTTPTALIFYKPWRKDKDLERWGVIVTRDRLTRGWGFLTEAGSMDGNTVCRNIVWALTLQEAWVLFHLDRTSRHLWHTFSDYINFSPPGACNIVCDGLPSPSVPKGSSHRENLGPRERPLGLILVVNLDLPRRCTASMSKREFLERFNWIKNTYPDVDGTITWAQVPD